MDKKDVIKITDFRIGDTVEFVKPYNSMDLVEYDWYVPPIHKGKRGVVKNVYKECVHIKVEGINNLVTLWDAESFPRGGIPDKTDCVKIIRGDK